MVEETEALSDVLLTDINGAETLVVVNVLAVLLETVEELLDKVAIAVALRDGEIVALASLEMTSDGVTTGEDNTCEGVDGVVTEAVVFIRFMVDSCLEVAAGGVAVLVVEIGLPITVEEASRSFVKVGESERELNIYTLRFLWCTAF